MESIEEASAEHANGINQVNKAIMDMDQLTQENATMVEQSAVASEQMASEAERLRQLFVPGQRREKRQFKHTTKSEFQRVKTKVPSHCRVPQESIHALLRN